MPFLILAALVVIVLMLYIALGGKEGAPTISLNKIFDFIMQKPPAGEAAPAADAPEAQASESEAAPSAEAQAPGAEASEAAEKSPAADGDPAEAEAAKDGAGGDAPSDPAFASMEELTEFYRKEAERLTGIKH